MPDLNLETIVAIFTIVGAVVGAATAYLKLYIGTQLSDATTKILTRVEEQYIKHDVANLKLADLDRRVRLLESNSRETPS